MDRAFVAEEPVGVAGVENRDVMGESLPVVVVTRVSMAAE